MGLSKSFRKALNHSSSTETVVSVTSMTSSNTSKASSPNSSRTASSSDLPDLLNSATIATVATSTKSLNLKKSSSSSSSFKTLIRSFSSNKAEDPMKYAPKKFKWRQPDAKMIATLGAWDMSESWGSDRRFSVLSGYSPSTRNSIESPFGDAEHVESC